MSEVGLTDNVVEMVSNDVCRFCEDEVSVPAWRKKIVHHLIVTVDEDGHGHVHGPVNDAGSMQLMMDFIRKEIKI